MSKGLKVQFIGKVINPPRLNRVPSEHKGTYFHVYHINKIACWLANQGWNVIFERGGDTGVVPALRNITIDTAMSKPTMLYSILHEAGHVRLFSRPGYVEKYKDGYVRLTNGKNKKSLLHKMDVLAEEFDAWKEGEAIARELNIPLDWKGYKTDRNRSIKTYVEWVVK